MGKARDILYFINRDMSVGIKSVEILELKELRRALEDQFASMQESWDNLIQCAIDHCTIFDEIAEIFRTTKEAVDKALV